MGQADIVEQISLFDDVEIVRNIEQGKDELNLAEFPICSLYRVRDSSVKTLRFEDQILDKSTGELVDRKLTVTASDEYGLPCAFDDEVILALIQLTKLQGFRDRKVFFTKRQILEVLGWDSGGKNTRRVEESLKRWLNVTLAYDRAWRNRVAEEWDTQGFHILENVYFREHQANQKGKQSYIVWNEVVFQSMRSGNLKPLNFTTFKSLSCPTAKRIFRFLDKRFYHRRSLRFDLGEFAYQKIGIDRRYGAGEIKRKLAAGIGELERMGFLRPMDNAERYRKAGGRKWNIYFEKGDSGQQELAMELSPQTEMETRMVALGVTKSQARKLYDSYSGEFLKLKIEEVEFLASKPDTIPKNPGGFLVRSLKEKYESPEGFKSAEQKERESASAESAKLKRLEREKNQQREAINNHLQLEYSRALVGEIEGALKASSDRAALEKEFVEEIVPGDDYLREDFARKGIEGMMVKIQFHDFLNKHWKIEERFTFDEFMKRDGFVIEEGAKSCVLKRNGERVKVAMNW